MRALLLLAATSISLLSSCGTVGDCAASQPQQLTASDGGTVTCQCKGACGCFYEDAGRCPQ